MRFGCVSGGVRCVGGVLEPREPLGGPIRHADFLHVTAFY